MTEEKDKINESSLNNENIQKLKNLLNNDKSNLFDILALKQKVKFDDKNEEMKINNDIWQRQYSLIFPPKDSQKISKPKISQLNILISSAEEYNINDNDKIKKLKMLQEKGNNYIREISKIKNIEQLNIFKSNLESFNVDLNEYFIQREMKLKTVKDTPSEINPPSKNTPNDLGSGLFLTTKEISNKLKPKKKSYKKKEDSYEADFIQDGEESEDSSLIKNIKEINKKESSSFKRYANALQMEAENFVNSRSRRNIKKKQDDDYLYEDDLNKEGNEKDELGLNDSNDDKNDVDIIILHKRKKKANDDEEYSEDSYDKIKEKKEQKLNEKLLNKKVKRAESVKNTNNNLNNLSLNKTLSSISEKELKDKSRQKALTTITDLLKNNKYLMEQGLDYVNSLAKKVEEDLAKAYPDIDHDYHKTLTNMTKTLKEITKYKRINHLIIKGKIMLFKMAKFNFGEKFIQKLKKVEEGNRSNNKPVSKQKSKVNAPSLDILNNYSSESNRFQSKDSLNINKTLSGISYRSGLTQSSFNEERNNENNNEDSLDSIEEQNNIKFSPGGNNNPNRETSGNIEQILEHTYDPFNSEKINSSNLLFPILYDPSLTMDEDSISEDHISNQDNEDNNNIKNNEIIEPPHKGSVLRLYHGKIKLNHNVIDKVSLYSFNKYEKFLKFPSFDKELILTSKAKSNEVIPYCLKQIKNNSKTCLYGWIEPEPNKKNKNIEANKFSELIEEFERNEKCSCLVENKIKLYIFTLSERDQKLYNKIIKKEKFINKRFMELLTSDNKFLVFVLLANNDDLENDIIKNKKKMSPEIITQLDFSEDEDEEDNLTLNKKNKTLSIVMEEEEENLPNSSLKKNNNNENKVEENNNENNDNNNNDEDEESLIDKEENEKLKIILEQNDFNTINEYIENNFKDLPLEEMATKLQRFTSENREKLLNSIKEYSEHFAQNDNNNQMDVENDNNNNNINQMQSMNNMGMINPNYGINMYQNESGINQMYMGGINNMNNIQQQQNNNNVNNMNPNLQQMYYNQGMNIYNNYNQNFK